MADARAFLHEPSQTGPSPSAAASTRDFLSTHTPASGPSLAPSPANAETDAGSEATMLGSTPLSTLGKVTLTGSCLVRITRRGIESQQFDRLKWPVKVTI
jgi:hypothetical protein